MSDILEELTAARKADAAEREKALPFGELVRRAEKADAPRGFAKSFSRPGVNIIAELKRASPSEGMIREDFKPVELALSLEAAGAAALSVLCEPHRFLGDEKYLFEAREKTSLPVLYKDFISTRYQIAAARAAGADAVLLIAAVLGDRELADLLGFARDFGMDALVETHDAHEIERAHMSGSRMIGVNCRNLRNFDTDVSLLEELVAIVPEGCVRIAESGMHSRDDIARAKRAGADGFLVGTALMRSPSPAERLKDLTAREKEK